MKIGSGPGSSFPFPLRTPGMVCSFVCVCVCMMGLSRGELGNDWSVITALKEVVP